MSRRTRLVLVAVVAGLLALGAAAGPAAAGDGWAVIEFEPSESTAAPGETVEVDVMLSSHETLGGEGLSEFELQVEYNVSHLTVIDAESGGWFEQDEGGEELTVTSSTAIDDEAGVVSYEEVREPAGDGTTGNALAATVTIEVDEDAPATNTTLSAGDSSTLLAGGYPHPVSSRHATLTITDGGSTADTAPSPVIGGVALFGALLSTHLLVNRRQ